MTPSCGAAGRRIVKLPAQDGRYEHLVLLECTDDAHEGDKHYDATFGMEFGPVSLASSAS